MVFTPNKENILEKHIKNEISVSVGIDLIVVDRSTVLYRNFYENTINYYEIPSNPLTLTRIMIYNIIINYAYM